MSIKNIDLRETHCKGKILFERLQIQVEAKDNIKQKINT